VSGDRSRIFTIGLAISWLLVVALPTIRGKREEVFQEG